MKSRTLITIITILLIYSLLTFYVGWTLWMWVGLFPSLEHLRGFLMIATVIAAYSYFFARFSHHFTLFKIIGSYWMAFFQYALILFPLGQLTILLLHAASVPMQNSIFWVSNIILFLLVFLFLYGSFNAYSPVVRSYQIKINKNAGKLKKLRMVVASDMHFGTLSGVGHLRRLVDLVGSLQPDLILLPGDIIDDEPGPFIRKNMGNIMSQMTAPLGVYGVLGNHEYYGGKIPEFIQVMNSIGIYILMDEFVQVEESINIIGRKDRTDKHRKSVEELISGIDKSLPLIMMDHQPFHFDQAEVNGIDVLLSGHTHRGQMAPNHLITKKKFELDWGYLKKTNLHVFVSSGFGFWGPPIRIGSQSEVVLIDIEFTGA